MPICDLGFAGMPAEVYLFIVVAKMRKIQQNGLKPFNLNSFFFKLLDALYQKF